MVLYPRQAPVRSCARRATCPRARERTGIWRPQPSECHFADLQRGAHLVSGVGEQRDCRRRRLNRGDQTGVFETHALK